MVDYMGRMTEHSCGVLEISLVGTIGIFRMDYGVYIMGAIVGITLLGRDDRFAAFKISVMVTSYSSIFCREAEFSAGVGLRCVGSAIARVEGQRISCAVSSGRERNSS